MRLSASLRNCWGRTSARVRGATPWPLTVTKERESVRVQGVGLCSLPLAWSRETATEGAREIPKPWRRRRRERERESTSLTGAAEETLLGVWVGSRRVPGTESLLSTASLFSPTGLGQGRVSLRSRSGASDRDPTESPNGTFAWGSPEGSAAAAPGAPCAPGASRGGWP